MNNDKNPVITLYRKILQYLLVAIFNDSTVLKMYIIYNLRDICPNVTVWNLSLIQAGPRLCNILTGVAILFSYSKLTCKHINHRILFKFIFRKIPIVLYELHASFHMGIAEL